MASSMRPTFLLCYGVASSTDSAFHEAYGWEIHDGIPLFSHHFSREKGEEVQNKKQSQAKLQDGQTGGSQIFPAPLVREIASGSRRT